LALHQSDATCRFISEDVPELVATQDRKGLLHGCCGGPHPMVQEQQGFIQEQQKINAAQAEKIAELENLLMVK